VRPRTPLEAGAAAWNSGGIRPYPVAVAFDRDRRPLERIAGLCERHRIRRLALFGSVLREDFRPDSDVDVLVECEPGTRVGLRFFAIQSRRDGRVSLRHDEVDLDVLLDAIQLDLPPLIE